ncbi:MAG TPA: BTAD domain-containing putative transcriptional regulator, partial [Acidothermaceae bacterium]
MRDESGRVVREVVAQPRRTAILAYLAIARPHGFHRRDTLVALFWPESSARSGRDLLNTHLSRLRAALGAETVVSRANEEISIDADHLWCDVRAFEAAFDAALPEDALALYRGDLLDGFHISDAPDFERWLDNERARLRAMAVTVAFDAAETRLGAGDIAAARKFSERGVALCRDDEGSLRRAITLLDNIGDRAAALRLYEGVAERLRREYDAEPSPETRQLIDRVRRRTRPSGSVAVVPMVAQEREPEPAPAPTEFVASPPRGVPALMPAGDRRSFTKAAWALAALLAVVPAAMAPRWVAASSGRGAEPTVPIIILGSGTHAVAGRDAANRLVACSGPSCPAGSLPQAAYVVPAHVSYAPPAAGTNYIAPVPDATNLPAPGYACCSTATFENTFRLPPDAISATISVAVSADNQATVVINGTEFGRQRDRKSADNYAGNPSRFSTTFAPDPSGI